MSKLEVWGGIECTINRVGDRFYRQLDFSGHALRAADLELIGQLGITALRYPVLWEDVAPDGLEAAQWRWTDQRLARLRELHIMPIAGLLHHGSGPAYTHLLDAQFPRRFAEYASAVAQRYPWLDCYTPINEPLTTARFSALYGLWYPHARGDKSFVRALLNQCRATVLAMAAIRRVNPRARLVQTDDLGKIYSSAHLSYQAEFENHRRWLSWDLLCGRVSPTHVLYAYLQKHGASAAELDWFVEHPCLPDVIGINHYLTSNRYLHQQADWCPREQWGGNGIEQYADTEAVRVLAEPLQDISSLIDEAWQRYRLPLAITEVHLGCTREEQLRWLWQVWQAAQQAQANGVDMRAITVWALLGTYDWNSLLTRFTGHYESGAFDVRSNVPRPTAVAKLINSIANGGVDNDAHVAPLLALPGWWQRESRLLPQCAVIANESHTPLRTRVRPVLITGARGTLGSAFVRLCEQRGIEYHACLRHELDIADAAGIEKILREVNPWAVINTAGYVRVDDAEHDQTRCYRENVLGAQHLASACGKLKLPLLTFSSDLVFDGEVSQPYRESHATRPLNIYGHSKLQAEHAVLDTHASALVIRTSSFFGPWDQHNFLAVMLRTLKQSKDFTAMDDVTISPTYVPDLVHASLDLLIDGEQGIWHLVNRGAITWAALARQVARSARLNERRILSSGCHSLRLAARRPRYSALTSERGLLLATLDDALDRYVAAVS